MTIELNESQVRAIDWSHQESELADATIRPAEYFDDSEFGGVESDSPVSEAYGWSVLSGRTPDGRALRLTINWQTSGVFDRTFAGLYDFYTPEINFQMNYPDVEIEPSLVVFGDDNEPLTQQEMNELLDDIATETICRWQPSAAQTLPKEPEPEELTPGAADMEPEDEELTPETADMETFILQRDNDRDVRFSGEQIADEMGWVNHEDSPWCHRQLTLFYTAGGSWVCEDIWSNDQLIEQKIRLVHIAKTKDELFKKVGFSPLAKELYQKAKIDAKEYIN